MAACVTTPQQTERMVGANQPTEYKEGFKDGCDSGYSAAGHVYYRFTKNVSRYALDELYKQGWDDGCMTCKGQYQSIQGSKF
jgi:hypothetical protein